jgi:DNA-binding NarL/FixJ family response regulator
VTTRTPSLDRPELRFRAGAEPTSMPGLRVLVADDHEAVRTGLHTVLTDEVDLVLLGTVATAEDAFNATRLYEPDVVVLDYQLPDQDGLTLARRLKALPIDPRILIYSAYADARLAIAAVVAGADGLVSKAGIADELCQAIRGVARGSTVLPAIGPAALRAAADVLGPDDAAILGMLVHGAEPREVAEALDIAERWLDARRWAMLRQLLDSSLP